MSGEQAGLGHAPYWAINDFAKTVSFPLMVYQEEGDDIFKHANTRTEARALMYELVRNTGCTFVHVVKYASKTYIFPSQRSKPAGVEVNEDGEISIVCPIEEVDF